MRQLFSVQQDYIKTLNALTTQDSHCRHGIEFNDFQRLSTLIFKDQMLTLAHIITTLVTNCKIERNQVQTTIKYQGPIPIRYLFPSVQ